MLLDHRQTARVFDERVRVFEKLDGINVGLRFDRNRSLRITPRALGERTVIELPDRFGVLATWATRRLSSLWALLGCRLQAYGEWLGEPGRAHYSSLPDKLLFFDLFEVGRRRFLGRVDATRRVRRYDLAVNPQLFHGRLRGVSDLPDVGLPSALGCRQPEGWIVEAAGERYKFVRRGHARRSVSTRANRVAADGPYRAHTPLF